MPDRGRRSLPDGAGEATGALRTAGRATAPPVEFGQRGEDRADAGEPHRQGRGARLAARRPRASRRRLRLWIWSGLAAVLAAAAAVAATSLLLHRSARTHMLVTPSKLGTFVRSPQLEKQMNARQLQQQVIAKSAGQASHVVSAVYESSAGASGGAAPQIILFIGGNLTGVSPSGFITSFNGQFKGAQSTSAGSLGGKAACVNAQGSATGSVTLCTWADSDTFGVVASQTMNVSQLSAQMRAIRPGVERPAR